VNTAVGLVVSLARGGYVGTEREAEIMRLFLARNADLLILAKHYGNDMFKFLAITNFVGSADHFPDAIIFGSGLAGLTAALNILDRGGKIVIMEKEHLLGGNSNRAFSGINAFSPCDEEKGDCLESFKNDMIKLDD
jgi:hypothetical protein